MFVLVWPTKFYLSQSCCRILCIWQMSVCLFMNGICAEAIVYARLYTYKNNHAIGLMKLYIYHTSLKSNFVKCPAPKMRIIHIFWKLKKCSFRKWVGIQWTKFLLFVNTMLLMTEKLFWVNDSWALKVKIWYWVPSISCHALFFRSA